MYSGQGLLGIINSKLFEPETWLPLIENPMGRVQYGKFIDAMISRIRLEKSNADEVRAFVNLVASDGNHALMTVALPHMPEVQGDA